MTTDASAGLTRYVADIRVKGAPEFVYHAAQADALLADLRGKLDTAHDLRRQLQTENVRLFGELTAERAKVREFGEYLQMLAEQYPSAQSLGGTYLSVLLREKRLLMGLPASVDAKGEAK
jgi:hypothetical protein